MSQIIIIVTLIIALSLIYTWIKRNYYSSTRLKYSDYQKRIDKYSLRIQFNPLDSLSYYERGKVYLKLGNKLKALEYLKLAGIYGYTKAYEIIEYNKLNEQTIIQYLTLLPTLMKI